MCTQTIYLMLSKKTNRENNFKTVIKQNIYNHNNNHPMANLKPNNIHDSNTSYHWCFVMPGEQRAHTGINTLHVINWCQINVSPLLYKYHGTDQYINISLETTGRMFNSILFISIFVLGTQVSHLSEVSKNKIVSRVIIYLIKNI
jgi:hypothetical protein